MTEKVKGGIIAVRDAGLTNMFDVYDVERIANEMELYDLVLYLEEKKNWKEYTHFILTGE